jgi:hypothetical protein
MPLGRPTGVLQLSMILPLLSHVSHADHAPARGVIERLDGQALRLVADLV